MASLTEIVEQMEAEGRLPRPVIEAHRQTLAALVKLTERIEALEHKQPRK